MDIILFFTASLIITILTYFSLRVAHKYESTPMFALFLMLVPIFNIIILVGAWILILNHWGKNGFADKILGGKGEREKWQREKWLRK